MNSTLAVWLRLIRASAVENRKRPTVIRATGLIITLSCLTSRCTDSRCPLWNSYLASCGLDWWRGWVPPQMPNYLRSCQGLTRWHRTQWLAAGLVCWAGQVQRQQRPLPWGRPCQVGWGAAQMRQQPSRCSCEQRCGCRTAVSPLEPAQRGGVRRQHSFINSTRQLPRSCSSSL